MDVPRPFAAAASAAVAVVVLAVATWLAGAPRAERAQTDFVRWFNDPPQPLAAILAVTNPLLRPLPLVIVGVAFIGWVLLTATGSGQRVETLRALLLASVVAELFAQVLKQVTRHARPLAVLSELDAHGYPISPHGNAFPSAHTAVCFALMFALWPWTGWPQRVAGTAFAVLVALNRIYVAAHWPLDVLGGLAIGLLAGSIAWLVADWWPIQRRVQGMLDAEL